MAHMYPPAGPAEGTTSAAELRIYNLLKQELDDEYTVFHQIPWHNSHDARDGEVDFIVIHPRLGVILIEVKGGGIEYDGVARQWTSKDKFGRIHAIKDPFRQAMESTHSLVEYLKNNHYTSPFRYEYRIGYAVWFPDIRWPRGQAVLAHVTEDVVLDANDRDDPITAIERVSRHFASLDGAMKGSIVSREAQEAFARALTGTTTIEAPFDQVLQDDMKQLVAATAEQYRRLDAVSKHPRLAIRGAAGTGKTILAIDKARALAGEGFEVLLVTNNPLSARWIAGQLDRRSAGSPDGVRARVHVRDLLTLCKEIAIAAGTRLFPPDTEYRKWGSLVARSIQTLENRGALAEARVQSEPLTFDAVLVDDAQDIRRDLFTSLRKLLRDRRNGLLYAFYDPALQDISSDWNPSCISSRLDLLLPDNCRNTEFIYRLVMEYYPGDEMPVSRGPQGQQVLCADPAQVKPGRDGDAELVAVGQVISKLVIRGVRSADILIITCRDRTTSRWQPGVKAGIYTFAWYPDQASADAISVISAADANAIESPIVLLTELDGIDDNPQREIVLYQALSRAQLHLVVVGNKESIMPS